MSDPFKSWVIRRGGYFRRSEAKDCGYSDRDIQSATASGILVRLRHGYYSFGDYVADLSPRQRHWLVARAVLHRLGPRYAAVSTSACAAHSIDTWGDATGHVHVVRLDGRSALRESGVVFHDFPVDADRDIVYVDGCPVVRADLAVWQACCELSTEGALVCFNSGLHIGRVTDDDLQATGEKFARWPGSRTARLAFWMSDRRIETVGESRMFFLCWEFHLPRPEPQYRVRNKLDVVIARTDFAWLKYRHVGEFDGMVKYMRSQRPGEAPNAVLIREKRREDLVRDEDLGMSRSIWMDLEGRNRPITAKSLMSSMERSKKRYGKRSAIVLP